MLEHTIVIQTTYVNNQLSLAAEHSANVTVSAICSVASNTNLTAIKFKRMNQLH